MRLDCSGMEFEKLADLLEQGQFELLNLPVGDERKKPSDIRLVYIRYLKCKNLILQGYKRFR